MATLPHNVLQALARTANFLTVNLKARQSSEVLGSDPGVKNFQTVQPPKLLIQNVKGNEPIRAYHKQMGLVGATSFRPWGRMGDI